MTYYKNEGISITVASKDWGLSRNTLYTKIKSGELTRLNNKNIDVSEMVRVFGEPRIKSTDGDEDVQYSAKEDSVVRPKVQNLVLKIVLLKQELEFNKKQLDDAEKRAVRAEGQTEDFMETIKDLTSTMKLLEAPKREKKKSFWSFFKN